MRLAEYLDKGASLGPDAPCFTTNGETWSYDEVSKLSWRIGRALRTSGVRPGEKVAILSSNDPTAFACVFGISRAEAVWCPINPRNEATENRDLLDFFDCSCLIFHRDYAPMVERIIGDLPKLRTVICLDDVPANGDVPANDDVPAEGQSPWMSFDQWLAGMDSDPLDPPPEPVGDDVVALVGTGGTTGRPKGVLLTGANLEAMSAITLMSYPFPERPVYLALAPLTHAAGVLCLPIMTHGGEIVIMPKPDLPELLKLIPRHGVTHSFLPPTLIYLLLDHPDLADARLESLRCLWYGAAPMSSARLAEAIERIGPVLGQLFGQSEAPMMISTLSPAEHFHPDGTTATERFSSAGRPSPLVTVAIMDESGKLLNRGERGEIVVRGSLVMAGYYQNPEATAEVSRHGWHHTGDIGFLDEDNYLFIVDRAKDMIISGGFNVYSAEVEQAVLAHPSVSDCAVIGLPDDKWGERVTAVVQLVPGTTAESDELRAFVKERIGSVKAPKQVEIWSDLPRSKLGKVLKTEIKSHLNDN